MKYSKNFKDAITSTESILFVGSGISMWSGLPSWTGLLKNMVEFLIKRGLSNIHSNEIIELINKGDLLLAASLCASKMRDADLSDFIDSIFKKSNPQPHEIHELIVNLGPNCFITTNYDELIEDIFFHMKKSKLSIVNNDQPVEQSKLQKSGARDFIFKIHGSINSTKTIILSRENYRKLLNENRSTKETLKFLFAARPIVYIGFGLRDPDFLIIKDEISSTFHGAEREHFAIVADVGELESEHWKREYGINIITYQTEEVVDKNNSKFRSHKNLILMLKEILASRNEDSPHFIETEISLKNSLIRYCETLIHLLDRQEGTLINLSAKQRYDLHRGKANNDRLVKGNIPIKDVLNLPSNLILIGSPGTGKSNSVQRFTVSTAKKSLNNLRAKNENISDIDLKHSIPVLLTMKEYKGDIRKLIATRLPPNLDLDIALEKGWFTFIFDAVNEAPRSLIEGEKRILHNNLQWFTSLYSNNRFVITSRSMNYISFLDYPIYEIQPLHYQQLELIFSENNNEYFEDLSQKMIYILQNPLFLSLYLKLGQENKKVSDIRTLMSYYLFSIEEQIIKQTGIEKFVIHVVFSKFAYELVEMGTQTIALDGFLVRIKEFVGIKNDISEILLSELIKTGIIVTDIDGNISFFHQTITEYLAAFRFVEMFENDPFIVEEKIMNHKWNETLILFIGLLNKEKAKSVLKKIAETDMFFALKAFENAALKEKEIGKQLFEILREKIYNPNTSKEEIRTLAYSLEYVAEYGTKEELLLMQKSNIIDLSVSASVELAKRGVQESFDLSLQGLLNDNAWRLNGFDKALKMLGTPDLIDKLIEKAKELDSNKEELIIKNITEVIGAFESEELYLKISNLISSSVEHEKVIAINILSKIRTERAFDILLEVFEQSSPSLKNKIIYGFRDRGDFKFRPIKYKNLVKILFDNLNDDTVGGTAAKYLKDIEDFEIAQQAVTMLRKSINDIEQINLCTIVMQIDPNEALKILKEKLENYNSEWENSLSSSLSNFNNEYYISEYLITMFLRSENEIRSLILYALRNNYSKDNNYIITHESFIILFNHWENYCELGYQYNTERRSLSELISKYCYQNEKDYLLERLQNNDYKYRKLLIEIFYDCTVTSEDITESTFEWILSLINDSHWSYKVNEILSKSCDERRVREYIIPLLNSENEQLKSNAFIIIKNFERIVGKRFKIT